MLILTRRVSESFNIGTKDNLRAIKVTILGWAGKQIKIGIEAAEEIIIDRDEITQKKEKSICR